MKKQKDTISEWQLYSDYQWVWEMISSTGDYEPLSAYVVAKINEHETRKTKTLLHLGCGSGNMDFHLKQHFEVTGVDLSADMLASARKKNPECSYFTGDMRTFSTNSRFDAVIIPDSINYLRSPEEMQQVFGNTRKLLNPQGLLLVIVAYDPDKFPQNRTTVDTVADKGIEVTFIENNYAPGFEENTFEATFVILIRDNQRQKTLIDIHTLGLFKKETWFSELKKTGFEALMYQDPELETTEQEGAFLLIGKNQR